MHFIQAKNILNKNSMNLYRGCTHGCIYCDSRSSCYGMDHDFEDIAVKENAIDLLQRSLSTRRKKSMIGTGSMSDAYVHVEKKLDMTRKALEVIHKYGFGASVLTKSDLVLRDLDLLEKINKCARAVVQMTLTTADEELCRILEPKVSTTAKRVHALKTFHEAGIDTVVWLDPILPYINDSIENIKSIMDYIVDAGVKAVICFGMGLTLREGNREYFYAKLDESFPGLKERYIREYGDSYMITSPKNNGLMDYIHRRCKDAGIICNEKQAFEFAAHFPDKSDQLSLF